VVRRDPLAWEKVRVPFPLEVDAKASLLWRKGNAKAVATYEKALSMTEDGDQKKRIRGELAKLKP